MPNERPQRRMINMNVAETSGVDHPAHGFEGWLVRKAADSTTVARLNELVRKDTAMPNTPAPTKQGLIAEVRQSKLGKSEQDLMVKAIDLTDDINTAAKLWQSLRSKQEADDPNTPSTADAAVAPVDHAAAAAAPAAPAAPGAGLFKSVTDPEERAALQKMVADNEALRKQAADAETLAKGERDLRLDAEEEKVVKAAYPHLSIDHAKVAKTLRKMRDTDPEAYEVLKSTYDTAERQLDTAGMFAELGTSRNAAASGGAMAKATELAKGYVAAGVSPNLDAAMAKAWTDNPDLYTQYEQESEAR
jgi:hypothetical protein